MNELAIVLRGLADYLDAGNNRAGDSAEVAPGPSAKANKPKQQRKADVHVKSTLPKVKKEEVIKALQELSKLPGGRAKIDDILEDHLPEETPLKASNLKPAHYATVLEEANAVMEQANPEPKEEDEGFE